MGAATSLGGAGGRPKSRAQARDGGAEPVSNVPRKGLKPPEDLALAAGFHLIAGVDEAGRGPWAGPVVAAAVIMKDQDLGVRIDDSKRLTVHQRRRAYQAIVDQAIVGIGIVPSEVIDADNVRQASLQAMEQAVRDLSCVPELVLVDGNCAPRLPVPCWPIVKGDRLSYTIACASIVAKVIRDSLMTFYHRLFPAYRFDHHKGYGTSLHRRTLQRFGPSVLHRLSFKPVSSFR